MGRGYDVHVALASRTGVAVVELILRARRSLLAVVPIELCVRERVERALRMPMRMRAHTSRCGERARGASRKVESNGKRDGRCTYGTKLVKPWKLDDVALAAASEDLQTDGVAMLSV